MLALTTKVKHLSSLVEFTNPDLWQVFDEVIAAEMLEFANLETVVTLAQIGFEVQLPYRAFWGSLVNTVLLNHSLYPLFAQKDSLVDLTYYVLKV